MKKEKKRGRVERERNMKERKMDFIDSCCCW